MATFFINPNLDPKERFDAAVFMEYSDNYDPLTSEFLRLLPTLPVSGRYSVESEESRPDLVSYRIYGDTQYWWILLMYNNIIAVEDLQIGKILNYPSLGDLESLYFSLRSKERASG